MTPKGNRIAVSFFFLFYCFTLSKMWDLWYDMPNEIQRRIIYVVYC